MIARMILKQKGTFWEGRSCIGGLGCSEVARGREKLDGGPVNQRRGYSLRVWVKLLASYMAQCGDHAYNRRMERKHKALDSLSR